MALEMDTQGEHGGRSRNWSGSTKFENFSDAIDAIGFGPFQTRLVLLCGMIFRKPAVGQERGFVYLDLSIGQGWTVDAVEVLVVAFVLDDIAITFDLGSVEKGLVGSASFLGMTIGAVFWSVMADRYGRRPAFGLSLSVAFLGGIGSAIATSFLMLIILRVAVGFGVGGNLPVSASLVTEFTPTKDRAVTLTAVVGMFWAVGQVAASAIGMLLSHTIGRGEESFWRWFLALAAIPSVVPGLAYWLLPESPRFLKVVGRHAEAAQGLENLARVNGKMALVGMVGVLGDQDQGESDYKDALLALGTRDWDAHVRVTDQQGSADGSLARRASSAGMGHAGEVVVNDDVGLGRGTERAQAGDVRELFHTPILRRVTLCLWMVWFFENLSYYGIVFLLPRYYADVDNSRPDFTYALTILVGIVYIPGFFVGLTLCSEYRLGRVGALSWTCHATGILVLLMAATYQIRVLFVCLSVLALMSIAAPATIKYIITPELYATKYRTMGLGSASLWTRIGGFLAPVVAEVMYEKSGPVAPLLVFAPALFVAGTFAGMIPVEPAGFKLDDDSWDRPRDSSQDGQVEEVNASHDVDRESAVDEAYPTCLGEKYTLV